MNTVCVSHDFLFVVKGVVATQKKLLIGRL